MAYATVEDLEARWRTLSSDEHDIATTLLEDAAVYLESLVTVDSSDEHQAAVLKMVSCAMVKRAMIASESSAFGVAEATASMGPFSQTMQYSNPSGDFYLTSSERTQLGIGSGYIGSVPARIEGWYGSNA